MTARGRWRTGVALGAAAVAAGAALVTALRDGGEAEEVRATLNLAEAMGGSYYHSTACKNGDLLQAVAAF